MLTLWLHGAVGADAAAGLPAGEDLLVPLAPAPPGIAAYRPHPVSELLPVLTHRLTPRRRRSRRRWPRPPPDPIRPFGLVRPGHPRTIRNDRGVGLNRPHE